jgi:hypothetical protein
MEWPTTAIIMAVPEIQRSALFNIGLHLPHVAGTQTIATSTRAIEGHVASWHFASDLWSAPLMVDNFRRRLSLSE